MISSDAAYKIERIHEKFSLMDVEGEKKDHFTRLEVGL